MRLVGILAAALSPILFIAAFQAYLDGKQNLLVRRDNLLKVAERSIDRVEQSLGTSDALLEVFSEQIAAGRCRDVKNWLIEQLPALGEVVHFDTEGMSSCASDGRTSFQMHDMSWNERLKSGEETIRTDAFTVDGDGHGWIFALIHRLDIEGAFVGSAAFSMRAEGLVDIMDDPTMPKDVQVALVDENMHIFGSFPATDKDVNWLAEVREAERPLLFMGKSQEGVSTDIVISELSLGGLYAVVSRSSPGLFDSFTLRPVATIGLPLIAFSVALLAVSMAINHLVLRWLRRLQRLSLLYGGGRYSVNPGADFENSPEEIANLAEALNQMSHRIGERDTELKNALKQRDDALKEIHHRVKNNLQIVTSFLNLQSRRLDDEKAKIAIAAARHRIDALSVVHQTLYQNEQLDTVSLKPFLDGLLNHLSNALGLTDLAISLKYEIEDMPWKADDAIPLALFMVEAITNSTKYAFDESGGEICIKVFRENDQIKVFINDNGAGADLENDPKTSTGLGRQLKAAFVRQMGGEYSVSSDTQDGGYRITITIPLSVLNESGDN